MTFLVLIVLILLIGIARYTVSDRLSKILIFLYLFWWMVWLFLSTLNVYGLFPVLPKTYLLILLSLGMFLLGYLFANDNRNKSMDIRIGFPEIKIKSNKIFNTVLVICSIILGYFFAKYIYLSFTLPVDQLRMIRFSVGALFPTTKILLLFNFFIEGFVYFLYAIIAYFIISKDIKNFTFILSVFCLVCYAGIGSGRAPILYEIMAITLLFFSKRFSSKFVEVKVENDIKRQKKRKISIIVLAAVFPPLFIYASWLTAYRLGLTSFSFQTIVLGANELLQQFIIYFTGPFRALEYGIENFAPEVPYFWGGATFAGVNELAYAAFHLAGMEITNFNYIIGSYLQDNVVLVGINTFMNYSFTNIMIFYFDFGIAGVAIMSFLFGFFSRKSVILFEKRPCIPTLVLLVLIFQAMIFSVFSWVLQSPATTIVIIACLIWTALAQKQELNVFEESISV